MKPKEPNTRRDFIKTATVAEAAFTIVTRYVLGGNGLRESGHIGFWDMDLPCNSGISESKI